MVDIPAGSGVPAGAVRNHLALALDMDDLVAAERLASRLRPYFGVAKVGLELFSANGPEAVGTMADLGYDVFLDVKLHDIPTTVGRAATVLGSVGAKYLTLHAFGGVSMLRAGVEGLVAGADAAGLEMPTALAVTILTSDGDAPPHILPKRISTAIEGGCGGLVCSAADAARARDLAPRMTLVVPGIRPVGVPTDDQAIVATPRAALDAGADLLVVGRAVTRADDPVAAAAALLESITPRSTV
jgi:orotidine-5'-phosphate decarboxylase